MGKTGMLRKPISMLLLIAMIVSLLPLGMPSKTAQAANWPYGAEMVVNGSFETLSNGLPANWTQWDPDFQSVPQSYLSIDTTLKTHGDKGLKITDEAGSCPTSPAPATSCLVGVKSDAIPIKSGETYTAEVKAKVSLGQVRLLVRTFDANGNLSSTQYLHDSVQSSNWQTLSVTFTPPASHSATAVIYVYERNVNAPTEATFDEVTMRLTGNLLKNGGFEFEPGTQGFPASWEPFATGAPAGAVTTETDLAYVNAGKQSAKIVDNTPTPGSYDVGIKTPFIPIRPGEIYDITVKVKLAAGTIAVMARSFDGGGSLSPDQTGRTVSANETGGGWHTITYSFTPNASYTSKLQVLIYARDDASATTAYVDEVSVTSNELLFNPDFEDGSGTLPDGWSASGTPASGITWITAPSPIVLGSKGVQIAETSATDNLSLTSTQVKYMSGSSYTASVKVKATSGKAVLILQSMHAQGYPIAEGVFTAQSTPGVSGWQTLTITAAPPSWTKTLRLVLATDPAGVDNVVFDTAELRYDWPVLSPSIMPFRPAHLAVSDQNPPDFSWNYVDGADRYELQVATSSTFDNGSIKFSNNNISVNVLNLPLLLPGVTNTSGNNFYWRVRYHIPQGWSDWSDTRQFRIKEKAVNYAVNGWDTLAANVPSERPRILTQPDQTSLAAFRALKDSPNHKHSKQIFDFAKNRIDIINANNADGNPDNNDLPPANPSGSSNPYSIIQKETTTIMAGALTYLITGQQSYREFTKTRLMNMINWVPSGNTNYSGESREFREIVWTAAAAYDWLSAPCDTAPCGEAFTETERVKLLTEIYRRTEVMYNHMLADSSTGTPLFKEPYNSHGWTVTGYIAIISIAMMNESIVLDGVTLDEHAKKWFSKSVPARINLFNTPGGEDGAKAVGTAYWESSHQHDKRVADILKAATGVDLYNKAVSRNELSMPLYFLPVGAPSGQFGDGADEPMKSYTVNLLKRFAQVYNSPAAQWSAAAAQVQMDPYSLFSYPHGDESVPRRPPFELPSSRWQKDVGWVAMHSSLYDPERISLFFKSSSYGSYNHSHADQNSFTINAFGEKLAIDAGYYDSYGSAFHTNYYRTTLAHNAITYDGNKGQKIHDLKASGRIAGFASSQEFDGTVGDATPAYNQDSNLPGLDLARRGILYVKPNAFVVIDKLDAKGTASASFEYLLHADSSLTLDGLGDVKKEATIIKNQAEMKVNIQYPAPTASTVTSSVPNWPTSKPEQQHAKFTFPSSAARTIVSTYQPYRGDEAPSAITSQTHLDSNGQPYYQSLEFANGTKVFVRLSGSGPVTVASNNVNLEFDGMAVAVSGSHYMLLDGVLLKKDNVKLIESVVPATVALSESEVSISGDAPQLQVLIHTAAGSLTDETYTAIPSGGTVADGMKARGVHWTKTGNVMTIQSESGRHFRLNGMTKPGPKPNVTLTVRLNGAVKSNHSLAAHGTYDGGEASYGQLSGLSAGTYTIVSAPPGLIFEKEGAAIPGTITLGASPWVILDGAGGELVLTN